MKSNVRKILLIIQRSNGDVFLSNGLIQKLYISYDCPEIDLLVNEDTLSVAKLIPNIKNIITFSYEKKRIGRFDQETKIIKTIYKKYDLSICLTASDRSVIYALLSSKYSISAIEDDVKKSWWKRLLLNKSYIFDNSRHILINNFQPLRILGIKFSKSLPEININPEKTDLLKRRLEILGIDKFLIFHPSAQYDYKVYPESSRVSLLEQLSSLDVSIVVTGGNSILDESIKDTIPKFNNIHNFVGQTTLEEYFVLSSLSLGYVGMDTLNMHIASSQNKRIFAIFGPTNTKMWSPWSNLSKKCSRSNQLTQTYDNVTIFQANMNCVPCGKAGCNDAHGKSECLYQIDPNLIYQEVKKYLRSI